MIFLPIRYLDGDLVDPLKGQFPGLTRQVWFCVLNPLVFKGLKFTKSHPAMLVHFRLGHCFTAPFSCYSFWQAVQL